MSFRAGTIFNMNVLSVVVILLLYTSAGGEYTTIAECQSLRNSAAPAEYQVVTEMTSGDCKRQLGLHGVLGWRSGIIQVVLIL